MKPEKFDAAWWLMVIKLVSKLAVVGLALISGTDGIEEISTQELRVEEAKAGQATGEMKEHDAYAEYNELARYYVGREAGCDSALEAFSRHRDDDRDWVHVLEECHSEGRIE